MSRHATSPASGGDWLQQCIDHLGHLLPSQASIRDFVHHNTLHGFQHLPFPEALAAARKVYGFSAWLPEERCRAFHQSGRIDDGDLDDALTRLGTVWKLDPDGELCRTDHAGIRRRDVMRVGLVQPLGAVTLVRFKWCIKERGALHRLDDAVSECVRAGWRALGAEAEVVGELWKACVAVLAIDPAFDRPEERLELATRKERSYEAAAKTSSDCAQRAATLWTGLVQRVGAGDTVGALVKALSGEDVLEAVRPALLRHLGAHLDQGLAPWHNPARPAGFFAAWRQSVAYDIAWTLAAQPEVRQQIAALPDDPVEAISAELRHLGLREDRWPGYLERLALELPGWSGMFLWRQNHPGYAATRDVPVAMQDYLAVRLVLERLVAADIVRRQWGVELTLPALGEYFRAHPAELVVRHAFHGGTLPDWLLDLIEPHLPAAGDAALPSEPGLWEWLAERIDAWHREPGDGDAAGDILARLAWPLFLLAQHLGIRSAELRKIGRAGAGRLLDCLASLDADQRGFVWLCAYERHYREQIFAALAANHGRWSGHRGGAAAQLVFCMDDREEGMRRHLEEINPRLETLGAAAHFAVFQNYHGLDDREPTALCPVVPVVIVPAHDVHEVPRVGASDTAAVHARRHRLRLRWLDRLHQGTRRGLLAAVALVALAAPLALAATVLRAFAPGALGRWNQALRQRFDRHVATRLDHVAANDAGPATPQAPRRGFTDAEEAERIAGFLASMGLTRDFARLVVILGHGSNSTNNPHLAAYDCGACAGRHSGPNARLFAAMANRPKVRALLAEKGIHVPAATHFLGAEHNTCDDLVTWYDTEDIPPALQPAFAELDRNLAEAARAHARERCRRLYSAPLWLGPVAALKHVWARRHDWSQARPELGHATNACAFIGRRAMSRGAFFDRRSFLISYDPTQDPEGKLLERHLLVNGAVGAGISLEYYFSTANNEGFGCGSKVTHNVSGYFGVMQGAASDLATGLPQQMIEVHEAMRLLVVVEQALDVITAVYQRQPPLQELVGNGWIIVAAKDPDSGAIHLFDPAAGWLPWLGKVDVKTVTQSTDWFAGRRDALPPVLLQRPLAA